MKRPVLWLIILLVVAGGGFAAWYFLMGQGMNLAQLREKYNSRYEEKRQQLKKIANSLPPKGTVKGNTVAKTLDPKPVYDVKQDSFNTEIAMVEQLIDADVDLQKTKDVDLILFEGGLVMNLRILGPKSITSPDIRVSGKALERYEKSLNLTYVVAIRPVTFIRPKAINRETYTPGMADLEAFVVDLRTDKIVASCRIKAESAATTTAVFRQNETEQNSVEGAAYSTLWSDARAKLAPALREITGGTFEFNR